MTQDTDQKPAKSKGSRAMLLVSGFVAALAVCGWIVFFIGARAGADKATLTLILTFVAVAMEGAVWCLAAALGVKVFEARKRIWRAITGRRGDG